MTEKSRDDGGRSVDVILSVDPDRWSQAVAAVRQAGMHIDEALEEIGTVTGSVDEDRLQRLAAVDGVEAVERSRRVQLPPPDSPLQ